MKDKPDILIKKKTTKGKPETRKVRITNDGFLAFVVC